MAKKQLSASNQSGKAFENWVDSWCRIYEKAGRATIRKVDPPTRIVGGRRIIFLPNPFLDYIGSWTERGGRTIVLEAKANVKRSKRLPVNVEKGAGVRVKQWTWLQNWERAGAAAGVLWWNAGDLRLVTPEQIRKALSSGQKSVDVEKTFPVKREGGFLDTLLCLQT